MGYLRHIPVDGTTGKFPLEETTLFCYTNKAWKNIVEAMKQ